MRSFDLEYPDQARLKIARLEIEAILKKHDLAGVVALHTPGMMEIFYDIQPSYSCVAVNEKHQQVHIKLKAEDNAEQLQMKLASANMTASLANGLLNVGAMFNDIADVVDALFDTSHGQPVFVEDPAKQHEQ